MEETEGEISNEVNETEPILSNHHSNSNNSIVNGENTSSNALNGPPMLNAELKALSLGGTSLMDTLVVDNEVVVLNVGGFEYTTLRRTLLKVPALAPLFNNSDSVSIKDNKGRYFVDRDGRLFSYILQYLRTGVSILPETVIDVDMLRIEVDFYKLEDFGRKLTEHSKRLRAQKDNHEIVKINVGGKSFVSTRRTMIAYPNSLLARIFNGNQPNEYFYNGEVFFDRDPELFGHILQFLRNKTLNYSCTSMESKDFLHNLLCEARFFKLQDLIEQKMGCEGGTGDRSDDVLDNFLDYRLDDNFDESCCGDTDDEDDLRRCVLRGVRERQKLKRQEKKMNRELWKMNGRNELLKREKVNHRKEIGGHRRKLKNKQGKSVHLPVADPSIGRTNEVFGESILHRQLAQGSSRLAKLAKQLHQKSRIHAFDFSNGVLRIQTLQNTHPWIHVYHASFFHALFPKFSFDEKEEKRERRFVKTEDTGGSSFVHTLFPKLSLDKKEEPRERRSSVETEDEQGTCLVHALSPRLSFDEKGETKETRYSVNTEELFPKLSLHENEATKERRSSVEIVEIGDTWKQPDHSILEMKGLSDDIAPCELAYQVVKTLNPFLRNPLSLNEIKSCDRNKRNGKVIVEFTSSQRGSNVWASWWWHCRQRRGTDQIDKLQLSEHYTPHVKQLISHVYKMKQEKLITKFQGGKDKIRLRVKDKDPWIEISSLSDFDSVDLPQPQYGIPKVVNEKAETTVTRPSTEQKSWEQADHSALEMKGLSENIADSELTNQVVKTLNAFLYNPVTLNEIESCQRSKRNGRVIVQFRSTQRGSDIWENWCRFSRQFKAADRSDKLQLFEHFTPHVQQLISEAYKMKLEKLITKFQGGKDKIRVKVGDNDLWTEISSLSDFDSIDIEQPQHRPPEVVKLVSFARRLTNSGLISRYKAGQEKIWIEIEDSREWCELTSMDDFRSLPLKYTPSDLAVLTDNWEEPDHSSLVIHGISLKVKDENLDYEVLYIFNSILDDEKLGVDEIESCERHHSTGNVSVKLTSVERGRLIYYRRKHLNRIAYSNYSNGNKLYVNESLSPDVAKLTAIARKMVASKLIVDYQAGATKIRVKLFRDDEWIEISSVDDIRSLIVKYNLSERFPMVDVGEIIGTSTWEDPDYSTLVIHGLDPAIHGTRLQSEVLCVLNNFMKDPVTSEEIKSCQNRKGNVTVKFLSSERGSDVFNNRGLLQETVYGRDNIFISEHFSVIVKQLIRRAHDMVSKKLITRFQYTKDRIRLKVQEDSKWVQISSVEEFRCLNSGAWETCNHSSLEIVGAGVSPKLRGQELVDEMVALLNSILVNPMTSDEIVNCARKNDGRIVVKFSTRERGCEVYHSRKKKSSYLMKKDEEKRQTLKVKTKKKSKSKSTPVKSRSITIKEYQSSHVLQLIHNAEKMLEQGLITQFEVGTEKIRVRYVQGDFWSEITAMKDFRGVDYKNVILNCLKELTDGVNDVDSIENSEENQKCIEPGNSELRPGNTTGVSDDLTNKDTWKGPDKLLNEDKWKGPDELLYEDKWKGSDKLLNEDKWKGPDELLNEDKWKGPDELLNEDEWKGPDELLNEDKWKGPDQSILAIQGFPPEMVADGLTVENVMQMLDKVLTKPLLLDDIKSFRVYNKIKKVVIEFKNVEQGIEVYNKGRQLQESVYGGVTVSKEFNPLVNQLMFHGRNMLRNKQILMLQAGQHKVRVKVPGNDAWIVISSVNDFYGLEGRKVLLWP